MRLGTGLPSQNNILLANGFVAKANQIIGFIEHKAVFDMLFSRVKQCDVTNFIVKVWQKYFTLSKCTEPTSYCMQEFPNSVVF